MSRVKAELLDGPVPLETDMTHLVQKNSMLPYPQPQKFLEFLCEDEPRGAATYPCLI